MYICHSNTCFEIIFFKLKENNGWEKKIKEKKIQKRVDQGGWCLLLKIVISVVCRMTHVLFTLCVFACVYGVQHILCCVFFFFLVFVLCNLCCRFLWIVFVIKKKTFSHRSAYIVFFHSKFSLLCSYIEI
jgi:hypothetical protein